MSRKQRLCDLDVEELISTSGEWLGLCYPKNAGQVQPIDPKEHADLLNELVDEGLVTSMRRDALISGKAMKPSERKQLLAHILRLLFDQADHDICSAICMCEAPPEFKDKRVLPVLSQGYSFTIVTREVFGAFRNKEEALVALGRKYYLELDYQPDGGG